MANCVRYFCAEQKLPPMSTGGSRIFGWHSNCCTLILTSDSRTAFDVAHATGTSCNQIKHSHSHTTHNHTHTQNGKQTALAIRLPNNCMNAMLLPKSTLQMLHMQAVYYMRHSMCNGTRNVHLCESVYVCESATPHAPMFVLLFCGNTDRPTDRPIPSTMLFASSTRFPMKFMKLLPCSRTARSDQTPDQCHICGELDFVSRQVHVWREASRRMHIFKWVNRFVCPSVRGGRAKRKGRGGWAVGGWTTRMCALCTLCVGSKNVCMRVCV